MAADPETLFCSSHNDVNQPGIETLIGRADMQGKSKDVQVAPHVVRARLRQGFRALQYMRVQAYVRLSSALQIKGFVRGKLAICTEFSFSRSAFTKLQQTSLEVGGLSSRRGASKLLSFSGQFATFPEEAFNASGPDFPL
jgi:hypothetical protein